MVWWLASSSGLSSFISTLVLCTKQVSASISHSFHKKQQDQIGDSYFLPLYSGTDRMGWQQKHIGALSRCYVLSYIVLLYTLGIPLDVIYKGGCKHVDIGFHAGGFMFNMRFSNTSTIYL